MNPNEIARSSLRRVIVCLVALVFMVAAFAHHENSDGQVPEAEYGLVLVAGATGRTGREVVSELLRKGFRVRAFVRDLDSAREKLSSDIEFAKGDVRERETIDAALDGVSIIISTIGASRGDPSNGPEFVDYGGVRNLADAAVEAQVSHFVLVSSMGVSQKDHALNTMFGNILNWKFKGEEALRNSGVPYTIVRPGGLTDDPGRQQALLFLQGDRHQGRIPRADVARVLIEALTISEARYKTFELISGEGSPSINLQNQFAALEED